VRDKIAASKRNGIWAGGPVPLGYRCIKKKLVVVPEESETVRTIFRRYLDRGSMVQAKLATDAVARKVRLRGSASILTGRIYDDRRNHLSPIHSNKVGVRYRYCVSHALLQNRKEAVLALWDAVLFTSRL
jgi:hypothetical protein